MTQYQSFNPEQDRLAPTEPEVQRANTVTLAAQAVRDHVRTANPVVRVDETLAAPRQVAASVPFVVELATQPVSEGLAPSEQVANSQPFDINADQEPIETPQTSESATSDPVAAARAMVAQATGQKD